MTDTNGKIVSETSDKTLSLDDLRVWDHKATEGFIDELTDRATRSDLEAVVREMGGVTFVVERLDFDQPKLAAGRYLILRIDDPIEEE